MKNAALTVEVPTALLTTLNMGRERVARDLRLHGALAYFSQHRLSLGQAAELAGITRAEFLDELKHHGLVAFDYDPEEVKQEYLAAEVLQAPE